MRRRDVVLLSGLAAGTLSACDFNRPWPGLEPSWERMMVQPHAAPYEESALFPNGAAMQPLPRGTRPYEATNAPPHLDREQVDKLQQIPLTLSPELLARGKEDFTVVCATCHGILGNGSSAVADRMTLRKPPSLHELRIIAYPPGHLFTIITEGFGLMPSYAAELPERDRWATIAYVRALQLSFDARLASLPKDIQAEAERQLP